MLIFIKEDMTIPEKLKLVLEQIHDKAEEKEGEDA